MNYTLLCDFYELTMGNGYFQTDGYADQICYFDVFFRNVPDGGGFAIAAGLEQVIDYIENLRFTEEDIGLPGGERAASARAFWTICAPSLHGRPVGCAGGHSHLPPGALPHRPRPRH